MEKNYGLPFIFTILLYWLVLFCMIAKTTKNKGVVITSFFRSFLNFMSTHF